MRGVTHGRVERHRRVQISTRTPHAGSDKYCVFDWAVHHVFQPALPMRGVTAALGKRRAGIAISTRTPHAGSDSADM